MTTTVAVSCSYTDLYVEPGDSISVVSSRTCFNAGQSDSVSLPSQDGGVCKPRPKGFGADRRSWRSSGFLTAVIQVSIVKYFFWEYRIAVGAFESFIKMSNPESVVSAPSGLILSKLQNICMT